MTASAEAGTGSSDSLASLERLKRVETDGEESLRTVRGKIDLTLSQMKAESEAQIQAAREQAEKDAEAVLTRAQKEAEAEAARIIAEAKASLVQRSKSGPANLSNVWNEILAALFGEFD